MSPTCSRRAWCASSPNPETGSVSSAALSTQVLPRATDLLERCTARGAGAAQEGIAPARSKTRCATVSNPAGDAGRAEQEGLNGRERRSGSSADRCGALGRRLGTAARRAPECTAGRPGRVRPGKHQLRAGQQLQKRFRPAKALPDWIRHHLVAPRFTAPAACHRRPQARMLARTWQWVCGKGPTDAEVGRTEGREARRVARGSRTLWERQHRVGQFQLRQRADRCQRQRVRNG